MFMWARKSIVMHGIFLPLRGGVGVFQFNRANRWGVVEGKEEGIRGLEKTAEANVGRLQGPDFKDFHRTVIENTQGVFQSVQREWELLLMETYMRKTELQHLLLM